MQLQEADQGAEEGVQGREGEEGQVITPSQFMAMMPKANAVRWLAPVNASMKEYSIDASQERMAMFLANVGQETKGLTELEENMNYSAARLVAVWPIHFQVGIAEIYAHSPEALANFIYADRMGNGNEASGDGWKFRGRGGGHLTGRNNYEQAAYSLGDNSIAANPDQVAWNETIAMRTAAWFWASVGGNKFADKGAFQPLVRAWNGGLNGLDERTANWHAWQAVLA